MKKKIISILMVAVMLLSSITAFAEKTKQDSEISSFLKHMGIVLPDNEVDIEDTSRAITKAEFVYLVVSAMGNRGVLGKEYLTFPDVKLDSWYHDNIVIAASKELIFGHENGYFGVDDFLDERTCGVIVLRALGFGMLPGADNLIASHNGVYSKLLKDVKQDGVMTLNDAYHMLYNMLFSEYVSYDLSIKESYHLDGPFMDAVFEIEQRSGRVTGNAYTSFRVGGEGVGRNHVEIDGVIYDTDSNIATEYLGYYVDYFIDKVNDRVTYMIPEKRNEVFEIASSDLVSCDVSNGEIILEYDTGKASTKKHKIPLACKFVYNGKSAGFTKEDINDLIENKVGSLKIVERGNDVMLDITAYDTIIVENVSMYDTKIYDHYDKTKYVSIEENIDGYLTVIKDGEQVSPSDIKKDDVIEVAASKDGKCVKIIVCDFVLTGAVTSYQDDEDESIIGIDQVMYPISKFFSKNRANIVDFKYGIKQKFLFNSIGELVDIVKDSAEDDGEYVFMLDKRSVRGTEEYEFIKYVTMDAEMETARLNDKVKYNGTKSRSEMVLPCIQVYKLIFIKKNDEGKIVTINTIDQTDAEGVFRKSDVLVAGGVEKLRKCKQQSAWLEDANDSHFPEFYTDSDTKILMVPRADSSKETFDDINNYEKKSISFFQDAQDYTVESYNLDDFNIAGIMLLKQEKTFDTEKSNNSMILVTSIGEIYDEDGDGDVVPFIKGYQNGEKVQYKLKDRNVLNYMNKSGNIQKYDIIRLNFDSFGYAIHTQYIKNVDCDCAVTNNPEGRNDGNAIAIGRVVSRKDDYLRLKFNGTEDSPERVFRGNVESITIYDHGCCEKGSMDDLVPGSRVLIRVYYTTIRDVIVIK